MLLCHLHQKFASGDDDGDGCTLTTGEAALENHGMKFHFGTAMGELTVFLVDYRLITVATHFLKVRCLHLHLHL